MTAVILWGCCAELLALCSGVFFYSAIKAFVDRNKSRMRLAKDERGWKEALLYKGIRPLIPLSKRLLKIAAIKNIAQVSVQILNDSGIKSRPDSFVSILLGASVALGLTALAISRSVVCCIAVVCASFLWLLGREKANADKRAQEMRSAIPDALRSMETSFKSGHSLAQTLRQVSKEIEKPLGNVFAMCADRLEMGAPTSEALAVMRDDRDVPELSFIAVALDVQHMSGGSIAPVLESARESVKDELDLMRSLRVQTAQAKLSANIVTVMPFILVAFFSFMSPNFLSPFFASPIGLALLSLALIMQLSGVLIVRRILNKDAS